MDGFRLDQKEAAAVGGGGKKESEDSSWSSHPEVQVQHRRSKSASDRNPDALRSGVLNSIKKEQNEASPLSTRAYRTRSPLHDRSAYSNINSSSLNQRASLEKDIELLQSRLQQEKSMRLMLERAMGRASSTLSPGHRHFAAQTKELIAEIELLEEEVANREQHAHEKVQGIEKTSVLRTLKDHLYQCPSKLSEEMVRCMAAVYCWLRSATSINSEKNRSPLLSRSSTNVVLPRRGLGDDQDFSCTSNVEISWISTDKSQFSRASYAISNYRLAYLAYGIPHNSLRRLALFHKAAYNIGGHIISANAIEQSIFCFRTPRVGRWLETILSTALRKKSGEEKQFISSKFGLPYSQPLACFALCTGAFSDPVLRVYTASNVKEELEVAKREFLQANVVVKKSKKVFLPRVLERFAKEAPISSDDLLNWVTENVDKKLHNSIQKCIDGKSKKKSSQVIDWLPYSSRFRWM
ncbi:hypothetical protein COLO4_37159 [Corchorus olitorius]|uniref:DUF547 domain-containing protein n=1 Tax=Corchorus olitorius TaxID=93759 RepID=A0A1R3G307_9ROSI|nr:hypothetical protein COLO4_37159 [Corchorus olitorius]